MLKSKINKAQPANIELKVTELLTIIETCAMLRISRRVFDQANRDNKIKVTKFGVKKMFVHIDEVNRLKRNGFY